MGTNNAIKKIRDSCKICKTYAATPRRFKLTVGTSDLRFNHIVQVDTMIIDYRPILHIVHTASHFCAAAFSRSKSTREIWRTLLSHWILIYVVPPDYLGVDQGNGLYLGKCVRMWEQLG